jgi:hypothetical protein
VLAICLVAKGSLVSRMRNENFKSTSYTSFVHVIFKSDFEFIELTLSSTNSMVDLKLGCIYVDVQEMYKRYNLRIFHDPFSFLGPPKN